ncbi:M24 family metallopeptidase [Salinibacter grassmerensis]|uniref:M24 family metallopeptidase n=1 Tax=Salinibacter grassmerensis TaxID=3040353 RepID=UPI0021E7AE13|nr:aminopeptidase P family protein [Salinibacter grassmerensis]
MSDRISRVRGRLDDLQADAVFLTAMPNIRWACGFTGSSGLLIVGPESASFITDGRYTDQARSEVEGADVHVAQNGLSERVKEEGLLKPFSRVAFQADHVSVARRDALAEEHEDVEWLPKTNLLNRLIGPKTEDEVSQISAAQSITETVFREIIDLVEPGMTEREIGAEIVYRHLKKGAESMAFDPIVASGPNGARPHARPTSRPVQKGDMVVIDMGCFRDGYASDMTRTVALGEPDDAARRGYDAVLDAQHAALDAARAGMTGKELDAVARESLEAVGLAKHFTHGLGHGLGLEVHEWPRVSHTADEVLPAGACVTIEPGVYLPEEQYGVRIEDIVVLREEGCENLTHSPKELFTL